MKTTVCYAANQIKIIYDAVGSHAATHFEDTPPLKSAVTEALAATMVAGETVYFEYDLGRVIGTADLVETSEHDEIIYTKRKKSRQVHAVHEVATAAVMLDSYHPCLVAIGRPQRAN